MISARELRRSYGGAAALRGVSFDAAAGEVVGLLGENGAGKSTTLRILAGVLAPDGGSVTVDGHELAREPAAARGAVGWLPEGAPAYPDMRAREYLEFRAALRGIPRRERRTRVEEAAVESGLDGEIDRVIGRLSRGYRQRLGLADALLHRPRVLLLDEPTEGLDPNQRRAFLDAVGRAGRERTIVLSTHVLAEVEAVCGRVVVLASGRVVADEPVAAIPGVRIEARGDPAAIERALRALDGASSVIVGPSSDGDLWRYTVASAGDLGDAAARAVIGAGGVLVSLGPADGGLAARFAALTRAHDPGTRDGNPG